MIMETKIIEHVARGFVEGMGIDSALWITSAYIPELAQPSPIQIPGWHPPDQNTHWDDLISIGACAGVTVLGAVKKDINIIAEGISMIAGAYVLSMHQPAAVPMAAASVKTKTSFEDLIKVD